MDTFRIAILNTQGNVASISNSIRNLGFPVSVLDTSDDWEFYNRLIVPGVGNIFAYSNSLDKCNFPERIRSYVKISTNRILGICVGFQYLSMGSEECAAAQCLKLLPIVFFRIPSSNLIRVPHVGWNTLRFTDDTQSEHYFTHSYAALLSNDINKSSLANATDFSTSIYGEKFISFYRKKNIFGIQSHPEKSRRDGSDFLVKFIAK